MGRVRIAEPFFAGFILGYLVYDGSHYAIHHFRMRSGFLLLIKKHHMLHHHADHDGGFGVSSPLWDHVFRTMPEPKKRMGAFNRDPLHVVFSRLDPRPSKRATVIASPADA